MCHPLPHLSFFFYTAPSPTELYTLSLHDALPICACALLPALVFGWSVVGGDSGASMAGWTACNAGMRRSEEHTSELQSHSDLVCRLLLEKKKKKQKKNNHGEEKYGSESSKTSD